MAVIDLSTPPAAFETVARPQTFADAGDRERLSPPAVEALKRLCDAWRLGNAEMAGLTGVSQSTWERMKRGARREVLSQDQLTRASALIGIFKGLRLLFADDMADRWPALANGGPLFQGETPVTAMIRGGIPAMLDIRRYVDAARGGL